MNSGLTPEKIKEIGEQVRDFVLATTKPENVSETLRRRILETTTPEERLAGLDVEERLAGMSAAERRALLRLLQEELGTGASEEARGNGSGV
jgi:hypothetical protein